MVVDVVDAIAVIALALGAVAELQIRILRVRPSTDRTLVAVGALAGFALIGTGPVGIRAGAGLLRAARAAPRLRKQVLNVSAEEQEIVCKGDKRHEPVERQRSRQKQENNVHRREGKVHPGKIFDLDGDKHHQKHSCLGREGCNGEKQAEVQRSGIDVVAEDEARDVAQKNAREIVEIKAADTPVIFEHFSELVIAEQTDDRQKQIIARDIEQVCEDVSKQPPDLPVQNFGRGEAEKTVDHAARVNDRQRIGDQVSDGDDEHQVRNAEVRMQHAEAVDAAAQRIQGRSLRS